MEASLVRKELEACEAYKKHLRFALQSAEKRVAQASDLSLVMCMEYSERRSDWSLFVALVLSEERRDRVIGFLLQSMEK